METGEEVHNGSETTIETDVIGVVGDAGSGLGLNQLVVVAKGELVRVVADVVLQDGFTKVVESFCIVPIVGERRPESANVRRDVGERGALLFLDVYHLITIQQLLDLVEVQLDAKAVGLVPLGDHFVGTQG